MYENANTSAVGAPSFLPTETDFVQLQAEFSLRCSELSVDLMGGTKRAADALLLVLTSTNACFMIVCCLYGSCD